MCAAVLPLTKQMIIVQDSVTVKDLAVEGKCTSTPQSTENVVGQKFITKVYRDPEISI